MEQEIWKDVKDYEGFLKISNLGNIEKMKYGKWSKCVPRITSKGYVKFDAPLRSGKYKNCNLHQFVCSAFNGEQPTKTHTPDHIDGNKLNNCSSNLVWATMKEQVERAIANGAKRGGKKRKIAQKTLDGKLIAIHESGAAAARAVNKHYSGSILMVCDGLAPTYLGFIWEDVD